jgi:trk system potassium uptake protein TrkH
MRYEQYLAGRYRAILGYTGGIAVVIGLTLLSPLLLLPFYWSERGLADGFLLGGLPWIILGGLAWAYLRPQENITLSLQEGMLIITLGWLIATLGGAVPFMVNKELTLTQAVFESTSGWTTTGLSVIDINNSAHLTLFYRSVIQLMGGAGFAIIVLSAVAGLAGSGLISAEGREDQLAPHVRDSASIVLVLYLSYVGFGIIALLLAGMTLFEAINHAFTAVAGGGFSTRAESIMYWDSALIEAIIMLLMFLGATNFLTAYTLLRGKYEAVYRNGELRSTFVTLSIGIVILFFAVSRLLYEDTGKQLRVAFFEAFSAMTTTGFNSTTYGDWPELGFWVLTLLMLIGAGSGSTAGGLKQLRIYILAKSVWWELRYMFLPRRVVHDPVLWRGDSRTYLTPELIHQTALFSFMYLVAFFIGAGMLAAHGHSMRDSLFEMASCLSAVGLSSGITTPDAPISQLWIQSGAMLAGRLEFFALMVGITKVVYDGRFVVWGIGRWLGLGGR